MKKLFLLLPLLCADLFGQALVYRSGVLTFSSDRPDSSLLMEANEKLRNLDLALGLVSGLRVQDSIRAPFYFNRKLAGNVLPDAPYWSGGIARSAKEIHIFDQDRRSWYTTLKHELVHIVLAQNKINLPVWMEEGLAQTFANESGWQSFSTLSNAVAHGTLLPLSDLDHLPGFSRPRALLAYAEASHAVAFFIDRYGDDMVPRLLHAPQQSFRERFQSATGETLADFEIAWREALPREFWFARLTAVPAWLWVLMPLLVIAGFLRKFVRGRQKMKQWEAEENPPPDRYEA